MALNLDAVASKTATVTVDYMGQSALITYNPSVLTQENITRAQKGDEQFVDVFVSLIRDWDVKRGTRKVPISMKGLVGIPLPFLRAVFRAVMRDTAGGTEEGNSSSGG